MEKHDNQATDATDSLSELQIDILSIHYACDERRVTEKVVWWWQGIARNLDKDLSKSPKKPTATASKHQ